MGSAKNLKQNATNKSSNPNYANCVRSLHQEDQELLRAFSSSEYKVLHGGQSCLYTLEITFGGSKLFLKTTKNKISREYEFYNLLMRNKIKANGNYFDFQKILGIIEANGRRGYLFDFKEIDKIRYNENTADKVIHAIAEMNAVNSFSKKLFAEFSCIRSVRLRRVPAGEVKQHILTGEANTDGLAQARHKAILSKWESVIRCFNDLELCLCSNDANAINCAIAGERILFLDMGKAAWAPFGSDLYWIARQARGILSIVEIISRYQAYLREFGKNISHRHIAFAAHACFAQKWLNVSKGIRSTLNSDSYLQALESAEYCLGAIQSL